MADRPTWLLIMGVSGCGKSVLGRAISNESGLPFVEGDDFHSAQSIGRMRSGMPLSDADRSGWLERLAEELRKHERGAVLSCSALKEAYRRQLQSSVGRLKVVHLRIEVADARSRVAARRDHVFPVTLVDSQFAILEPPEPGPDLLELSAIHAPSFLCAQALSWICRGRE